MSYSLGFGGGCHWCTEAVFQSLKGVAKVQQGFIRSETPHDTWSEAVDVTFNPNLISVDSLVVVHLTTHASASNHKMRGKYRSAIYTNSTADRELIDRIVADMVLQTGIDFKTQVLKHCGFKPSDDRFQNYYETDPKRPFCQTFIDPKIAKLRANYPLLLK